MFKKDPCIIMGSYFDKKSIIENSKLYEAFNELPKPVLHHIHSTCLAPVDYLIKLTYNDYVYLNIRTNCFLVRKLGIS